MIIGGIVVAAIAIFVVIFTIASGASNKLICKSDNGNITIMYNDKTVIGYKASGMTYDMDVAKGTIEKIGIDSYIKLFEEWFSENTTGSCEVKLK